MGRSLKDLNNPSEVSAEIVVLGLAQRPKGPTSSTLKKLIPARAEFRATTHELVWLPSSNSMGGKVQKSKVHNLSAPSAGTKTQFQDRFLR